MKELFKRYKYVFFVALIGLIFLAIGISYAFFNVYLLGDKEQVINIGSNMTFEYHETSNGLALDETNIISDTNGIISNNYFDFEVSLTGNETVNYFIYLTKDADNSNLPDNKVKLYLTDQSDNSIVPTTTVGSLAANDYYPNSYNLYEGNITSSGTKETDTYRLRVWIDETVTSVSETNGVHEITTGSYYYKFTVNVGSGGLYLNSDSSGANEPELVQGMIPVYYDETDDLWKKANSNYVYYRLGDVSGDGVSNSTDALMTSQYIGNKRLFSTKQKLASDVNGDGNITEEDQTLILRVNTGSITTFPVGDPLELKLGYVLSTNENNWYNYGDKKWANTVTVNENASSCTTCIDNVTKHNRMDYYLADVGTPISMDDINTMWVWIPRFNAVLPENEDYGTIEAPGAIDVTFINNSRPASDAFWWDEDNDGIQSFDERKNGFWYGKFETSHSTLTESEVDDNLECINETCSNANGIIIKPDVISLRNNNVSNFFYASRSMEQANNSFGFVSSEVDTHMSKNNEWAAVAYLTQSIYGRCTSSSSCTEVYINNSSNYYTGRSGGNVGGQTPINETYIDQTSTESSNTSYGFYTYNGYLLSYNTNNIDITTPRDFSKIASTTGNIYGVYDMSGGAIEYVMGNYDHLSGNNSNSNSGFTGLLSNGYTYTGTPFPNSKYVNIYREDDIWIHALGETSRWYGDSAYRYRGGYFFIEDYPWCLRSGMYYGESNAGIFYNNFSEGYSYNSYGTRFSIIK